MPPKPSPKPPDGASASQATTNGPNLPFISSEVVRIWKQRWNFSVTITAFSDLPRETKQAIFANVLSDDTIKGMNTLGLQDVNAIIESFQTQV